MTPRRSTTAWSPGPTAASSAVNELPDLAERIQVALLNVLEERDIAGPRLRSCGCRWTWSWWPAPNPEDYTNRGRIITPLKDRFGAEIRTHYPLTLSTRNSTLAQQEAAGRLGRRRPRARIVLEHLVEVIVRSSPGWSGLDLGSTAVGVFQPVRRSPRPVRGRLSLSAGPR